MMEMANHAEKMAKSPEGETKRSWTYLFHDRGNVRRRYSVQRHSHGFWQIDFTTRGTILMETVDGTTELHAGDCLFTPAEVEHGFHYPEIGTTWLSVKCAVEGLAGLRAPHIIGDSHIRAGIEQVIQTILATETEPPRECIGVLPHLFLALLEYAFPTIYPQRPAWSTPVQTMIDYASAHRYNAPSAADVAAAVGYSANHAATLFRRETGCALKNYLDTQRAEEAKRMLSYSEATITEIARRLGFPDVYAFSRFFRRVTGTSPRRFRSDRIEQSAQA